MTSSGVLCSNSAPFSLQISPGVVAEWSRSGLQIRVRRFDSGRRLQHPGRHRPRASIGATDLQAQLGDCVGIIYTCNLQFLPLISTLCRKRLLLLNVTYAGPKIARHLAGPRPNDVSAGASVDRAEREPL
jgi:hypothetical protein